jgi:acyl carrier protein
VTSPDREEAAARVKRLIVDLLGVSEADVQPDTLLVPEGDERGARVPSNRPNLAADSLDIVELVMAIEDAFGIEITDDTCDRLNRATVGQLIDHVHQLREAA